jgi:hypothetical protein
MTCPILLLARYLMHRIDPEVEVGCEVCGWCEKRKEENEKCSNGQ